MKIETTRDKLLIDERELQRIIKEHILEETGRTVHGDVNFQTGRATDSTTAWCHLSNGPGAG